MEKQADSISTVDMKEYPPSVGSYANSVQEAPPAYRRPDKSPAVQVAKIIAVTVVAVTILLGTFLVLAAWIQARASCVTVELDEPMPMGLPEAHRLYQDEPLEIEEENIPQHRNSIRESLSHSGKSEASGPSSGEEVTQVIRLPLQLTFDDLAGHLMENNARARMNCLVEKKKAEEIVDEQAKTVALPLGVNLTTDPRYLHFTGEKMAIVCESGPDQSKAMDMTPAEVLMPPPPAPHQMAMAHAHPNMHGHPNVHHPHAPHMQEHQEEQETMHSLPIHALPAHLRSFHALPLALPLPLHPQPHIFHHHHPQQQEQDHPEIIVVAEKRSGLMSPVPLHARSLPQPISLPLREVPDFHPHYIRPRSVDSSGEHKRDKRVKRCSCDCSC